MRREQAQRIVDGEAWTQVVPRLIFRKPSAAKAETCRYSYDRSVVSTDPGAFDIRYHSRGTGRCDDAR